MHIGLIHLQGLLLCVVIVKVLAWDSDDSQAKGKCTGVFVSSAQRRNVRTHEAQTLNSDEGNSRRPAHT